MRIAISATLALLATSAATLWIGCEDSPETTRPPEAVQEGAGCLDTLPGGLPYQPGCCGYQVAVPDDVNTVSESGFDSDTLGANPSPDHVHVSWAGPSDTTFAVNWRTDHDTLASQLLYGTSQAAVEAADGPSAEVTRIKGHHMLYGSILDGSNTTRVHETHVCGLSANTTYYYKVGGSGAWSPVYQVATAPVVGATDTFRFAVLGDTRDDPSVYAQVQEAIATHGVDFEIFTGDAVNAGAIQEQWNAFFEATSGGFAVQDLLATTPFMVTNGNHDNLAVNYVAQFAVPQELGEGEQIQGEEYYAFDYANAHFVALNDSPDSRSSDAGQVAWLEQELAGVDRAQQPWLFAFHHKTTYACGGSHESLVEARKAWQPVFDAHQLDIVFAGHNHHYERTLPLRGLDSSDVGIVAEADANGAPVEQSGTLYVVSGGAGAPLYGADDSCAYTLYSESVRNYTIVEIEGLTLRLTSYRLDGSEIESFEYTKSAP